MKDTMEEMRRLFDACASQWDAEMVLEPEKMRAIVTLAEVAPEMAVLDIACGTGVLTPFVLEREPRSVCGVDLSLRMIEKAKENCADARVSYNVQELLSWETNKQFDAAICYNAYPHFMDKAAFAKRAAALLRPGARLTIAHGAGRSAINAHHNGDSCRKVSVALHPAAEEAAMLAPYFDIDTLVDTKGLYVLSGIRK